jgi:hypothetical protein
MKGLLLGTDYDLSVSVKRDSSGLITSGLKIGTIDDQCAAIVLQLSQGDLKEDPFLGCGLTVFMRSKYSPTKIEARMRSHFTRAGLDFDDFKERINTNINTEE